MLIINLHSDEGELADGGVVEWGDGVWIVTLQSGSREICNFASYGRETGTKHLYYVQY